MEGAIRNILVPIDIARSSWESMEKALTLARQCGAGITLLYVVDLSHHIPETGPANADHLTLKLKHEGREWLGEIVHKFENERVELRALVEEGLPREKICEAARECDLIVIEKTKPKPFWKLFSRRTVEGLLERAPCPVMVVPESKSTEASKF